MIEASVETGAWSGTFLAAQNVVRDLLDNSFKKFLSSPFCQDYMNSRSITSDMTASEAEAGGSS